MKNKISLRASNSLLAEISKDQPQFTKIKQYLAEGADINHRSEDDGYTALMLAVDKDDEPLVTYLLQQGADPLIQNQHQEIASDLTLTHSPIYQLLKNYELLSATMRNDISGVKAILAAGANINFQGQGGYTALLIAVEQSLIELVELLMVSGADLSLERDDGCCALLVATDPLIFKTLDYGKPFSKEQKKKLLEQADEEAEEEERLERGRLKILAARQEIPFALSQLKMSFCSPSPSEAQLAELERYFGHPLPARLKEIFLNYNGGEPLLNRFGEEAEGTFRHFYTLDENRNSAGNIWWVINNFSEDLGLGTLPFAQDSYGGIYFLKWLDGKAQVWLFQYGDQLFDYEDEDESDNGDKISTTFSFIADSLDDLLEALYAAED